MRDYQADVRLKATELTALLAAWLDDLKQVDGTSELHDKVVLALSLSRQTLVCIETLPSSPVPTGNPQVTA